MGWTGVHVDNERKNEHVHIGPGGLHVDTPEDDGHSVHTNSDGTVTVDGETYDNWKDARDKLGHRGHCRHRSALGRAWSKFPFPAIVLLVYIVLGITYGTWGIGLFLAFLIPLYYTLGDFIDRPRISKLIQGTYAPCAIAWFCYQWLCLGQPHPAWLVLLTIPVVGSIMHWCRKQWKHHKRQSR